MLLQELTIILKDRLFAFLLATAFIGFKNIDSKTLRLLAVGVHRCPQVSSPVFNSAGFAAVLEGRA